MVLLQLEQNLGFCSRSGSYLQLVAAIAIFGICGLPCPPKIKSNLSVVHSIPHEIQQFVRWSGIGMLRHWHSLAWVCSGLGLSWMVSNKFTSDYSLQIILRSDSKAIEVLMFSRKYTKKILKIEKQYLCVWEIRGYVIN